MMECLVDIYEMHGDSQHKQYKRVHESIRCILSPASTDVIVLYDAPLGQTYQYYISTANVTVPEQSEVRVVNPQGSVFKRGQKFVSIGSPQVQENAGFRVVSGVVRGV